MIFGYSKAATCQAKNEDIFMRRFFNLRSSDMQMRNDHSKAVRVFGISEKNGLKPVSICFYNSRNAQHEDCLYSPNISSC